MRNWYRIDLLDSQSNTITQVYDIPTVKDGKRQARELLTDPEYASEACKVELLRVDEHDEPLYVVYDAILPTNIAAAARLEALESEHLNACRDFDAMMIQQESDAA